MEIVNLTAEHQPLYFACLEDWSEEMKEAGNHKAIWFNKMKERGLRVKLAEDDRGRIGGMIQYLPIEYSFAQGEGLYFINCIWVHGHQQGRGNFQKRGMGQALLRAAEEDARKLGVKGLAAWGIWPPFWMKAAWFKKQGYTKVDRRGIQVLLWKPFAPDAVPPKWIRPKKKPQAGPDQVTVTAFLNGWCPGQNLAWERAKRAAAEFGDRVVFREINTFDREVFWEWGISDALFIDDRQVRTGPPPSLEKIRKLIAKKLKKLG
jgi:GNAT superfamily N-acetyltransferase